MVVMGFSDLGFTMRSCMRVLRRTVHTNRDVHLGIVRPLRLDFRVLTGRFARAAVTAFLADLFAANQTKSVRYFTHAVPSQVPHQWHLVCETLREQIRD